MTKELAALGSVADREVRLVCLDIDGTLVNSNNTISTSTRKAVRSLVEGGISVCLATGRPLFAAKQIGLDLGITGPGMFFSGALIASLAEAAPHYMAPLSRDDLRWSLETFSDPEIGLELYTSQDWYIEETSRFSNVHREYMKRDPLEAQLEEITASREILKVVIMCDKGEVESRVERLLSGNNRISVGKGYGAAHPDLCFINFTNPEASRANAFRILCEQYGVGAGEVLAVGDGEADIPFLTLAGVGVAMGNAAESVKRAAKYVTKSVDQDGLAFALEKLVALKK
ncbi:MAG: hypothetical protein DCC75_12395 [Proteobacteria bacterium]|nr:MAG: hypothetical protein DCC75_12395 [Pseudomonadota bacterium]